MINKKINEEIPKAFKAIALFLSNEAGEQPKTVPKEYDGYAASFTASIVTAGLLPTLAFYTDIHKMDREENKERVAVRRYKLTQALQYILDDSSTEVAGNALLMRVLTAVYGETVNNPEIEIDFSTADQNQERALKKEIMDAAIALKLALRNFQQIENDAAA